MINKQQAIVDGSIEPGGFQTSQNSDVNIQIDVARDSDEHMMESEVGTEGMQNDQQRIEEDGFGLQNNQPLKQGPLKPISYRDLFKNSNESWKNCFKEWGFQEIDLEFEEGHTSMDSTTEEDDGIPIISLDLENKKRIIQPWKYCLIGKVVGKTVGYKFLSFKANAMWKLSGDPKTVNLEDSYGPWMIVEKKKKKIKGSIPVVKTGSLMAVG
ncbi:hypothetical protein C5167_021859 [Papaver somniferum]|uniref:DUF4283 domain-containing protein n=1 Tax=Papaver somniferum TaxID=3469 RepID=A0A4Y7JJW6_PAPSO|nr:hypothetical protein C5167_021859 [Papaver somniferum]